MLSEAVQGLLRVSLLRPGTLQPSSTSTGEMPEHEYDKEHREKRCFQYKVALSR
jgi:hypothetical protein